MLFNTETHFAGARRLADFFKQCDKVRVSSVVENDKSGIDRNPPALFVDIHGIRVAADISGGFEYREVVFAPELIGSNIARNTATNNGYLHACNHPALTSAAAPSQSSRCRSRSTLRSR